MQGSYEIKEYRINKEVCFWDYDKSFAYQQLILLIITFIITFIMIL